MHLILLRHTQTQLTSAVCYGNEDVPLAATFKRDIEKVVSGLPTFDRAIASPLSRCQQLAVSAVADKSQSLETDARLLEMNFGAWQGLAWDDVPRHELDEWAANFEDAKPHGGESVNELRDRLQAFFTDLAKRSQKDDKILIVSHAGVIRSALTLIEGMSGKPQDERERKVDYGEWIEIEYSKRVANNE